MVVADDNNPPRKRSRLSLKSSAKRANIMHAVDDTQLPILLPENKHVTDNLHLTSPLNNIAVEYGISDCSPPVLHLGENDLTCHGTGVPPVASLENLGNTCFLNSVLEVLRYTPSFLEGLEQLFRHITQLEKVKACDVLRESDEINTEASTAWDLVKNLFKMYKQMEKKEECFIQIVSADVSSMAVRPDHVLDVIRELNPMFKGNMQHDAQELLRCLLCCLEDAEKQLHRDQASILAFDPKIQNSTVQEAESTDKKCCRPLMERITSPSKCIPEIGHQASMSLNLEEDFKNEEHSTSFVSLATCNPANQIMQAADTSHKASKKHMHMSVKRGRKTRVDRFGTDKLVASTFVTANQGTEDMSMDALNVASGAVTQGHGVRRLRPRQQKTNINSTNSDSKSGNCPPSQTATTQKEQSGQLGFSTKQKILYDRDVHTLGREEIHCVCCSGKTPNKETGLFLPVHDWNKVSDKHSMHDQQSSHFVCRNVSRFESDENVDDYNDVRGFAERLDDCCNAGNSHGDPDLSIHLVKSNDDDQSVRPRRRLGMRLKVICSKIKSCLETIPQALNCSELQIKLSEKVTVKNEDGLFLNTTQPEIQSTDVPLSLLSESRCSPRKPNSMQPMVSPKKQTISLILPTSPARTDECSAYALSCTYKQEGITDTFLCDSADRLNDVSVLTTCDSADRLSDVSVLTTCDSVDRLNDVSVLTTCDSADRLNDVSVLTTCDSADRLKDVSVLTKCDSADRLNVSALTPQTPSASEKLSFSFPTNLQIIDGRFRPFDHQSNTDFMEKDLFGAEKFESEVFSHLQGLMEGGTYMTDSGMISNPFSSPISGQVKKKREKILSESTSRSVRQLKRVMVGHDDKNNSDPDPEETSQKQRPFKRLKKPLQTLTPKSVVPGSSAVDQVNMTLPSTFWPSVSPVHLKGVKCLTLQPSQPMIKLHKCDDFYKMKSHAISALAVMKALKGLSHTAGSSLPQIKDCLQQLSSSSHKTACELDPKEKDGYHCDSDDDVTTLGTNAAFKPVRLKSVFVKVEKCDTVCSSPAKSVSARYAMSCLALHRAQSFNTIEKLFQGAMVMKTKCLECECITERKENFQDVSVPLAAAKQSGSDTESDDEKYSCLLSLLNAFTDAEYLRDDNKYYCDKCLRYVEAERTLHFDSLPNIMTVHLKRFSARGMFGCLSKINDRVTVPLTLSCLRHSCPKPCARHDHKYILFAIITHTGSTISSGHYLSYIKVRPNALAKERLTTYLDSPDKMCQNIEAATPEKHYVDTICEISGDATPEKILPRTCLRAPGTTAARDLSFSLGSFHLNTVVFDQVKSSIPGLNLALDMENSSSSSAVNSLDMEDGSSVVSNLDLISAQMKVDLHRKGTRSDCGDVDLLGTCLTSDLMTETHQPVSGSKPVASAESDSYHWLECDDETVKILSEHEFHNRLEEKEGSLRGTPYVVFYHRLDTWMAQ